MRTGQGTYTSSNGTYDGHWLNNMQDGQGIYIYGNGNRYEGQWKNGQKHGQGNIFYPNGNRLECQWKNDKEHGSGSFFYTNGDSYEGKWENGTLIESNRKPDPFIFNLVKPPQTQVPGNEN